MGYLTNDTETRQLERALRETRRRLRTALRLLDGWVGYAPAQNQDVDRTQRVIDETETFLKPRRKR